MIVEVFLFLLLLLLFLSKCKPEPILGIYEQAGPLGPLKQLLMYAVIKLNKRRVKHKAVGHGDAWLGLAAEDDISVMESPRALVDHALACDAVWFGCAGRDGTSLIMSGARRKENILQSMVFINIPGLGLLRHVQHPETAIKQTEARRFRRRKKLALSVCNSIINRQQRK